MKTVYHLVCAISLPVAMVEFGYSQSITPTVMSWQINLNGVRGRSTDGSINAVVSAYDADVRSMRHNSTNMYVNSTGVPSYNVGFWLDENPAVATDRNWLFRIPKLPGKRLV